MKTINKIMMLGCIILFSAALLPACHKSNDTPASTTYTINGNANGSSVVPAVTGTSTGTITGTYDSNTKVLIYTTNWNGLTGVPTSAGFYNAASGQNGTIIGSAWNLGTSPTATGSVSSQMTLTADQQTQLLNGNWYYTVGTAAHASGEIRGQVVAAQSY